MSKVLALAFVLIVAGSADAADDDGTKYHIGRSASEADISAKNLTVLPDGTGLPPGSGTAKVGAPIYAAQCAACHGDKGEGRADFPALVGGRGTLATPKPLLTVGSYWPYSTTVFDYIRRAMPYQAPGELTNDELYSLTAWILAQNKIIASSQVMNRKTLPKVRMPNRDGFVADPRPDIH